MLFGQDDILRFDLLPTRTRGLNASTLESSSKEVQVGDSFANFNLTDRQFIRNNDPVRKTGRSGGQNPLKGLSRGSFAAVF